jgi:hypothetical protein
MLPRRLRYRWKRWDYAGNNVYRCSVFSVTRTGYKGRWHLRRGEIILGEYAYWEQAIQYGNVHLRNYQQEEALSLTHEDKSVYLALFQSDLELGIELGLGNPSISSNGGPEYEPVRTH